MSALDPAFFLEGEGPALGTEARNVNDHMHRVTSSVCLQQDKPTLHSLGFPGPGHSPALTAVGGTTDPRPGDRGISPAGSHSSC